MTYDDLVGRWAVDGAGRLGKITEVPARNGHSWVGEDLRGLRWSSYAPQFLCPDTSALLDKMVTR